MDFFFTILFRERGAGQGNLECPENQVKLDHLAWMVLMAMMAQWVNRAQRAKMVLWEKRSVPLTTICILITNKVLIHSKNGYH